MMTLVIGGAASGKSEFAEELVLQAGNKPRYYIATMQPFDDECRARIRRHREMRAQKQFETVECFVHLEQVTLPQKSVVLLECMSNLVANELYIPEGAGDNAVESIRRGILGLRSQCEDLIIVSNEVFSGGCGYEGDTLRYMRVLAEVNRMLASQADAVYEVICGVPVCHKGKGRENDPV